jgi:N4-gp56 family major capsid protein
MANQQLVVGLDIASDGDQSVIRWSRQLMIEALNKTYLAKFLGDSPNSMIQRLLDLNREPGDSIKFDLLAQLAGYGVNANTALLGAEQTLTYYQDEVFLNQKRQAHGRYRLSQQRTVHNLRADAMTNLTDFFARVFDEYLMAWFCGEAGASGTGTLEDDMVEFLPGTGGVTAQDANHLLDYSEDATTTKTFAANGLAIIDELKWMAKSAAVPIQPLRIEGGEYYVMFINNNSAYGLQQNSSWITAQQTAQPRSPRNPVFTGALGMWNGVVLHYSAHLPEVAVTGADHDNYSVICGKQAAVVALGNAFGQLDQEKVPTNNAVGIPFAWHEERTDYGNIMGIAASAVFGIKRTIFNSESFASIASITNDAEI